MKSVIIFLKQATFFSFILSLLFLNVKIVTTEKGLELKFINDILGDEWDCSQDPEGCGPGGTGKSSAGHWENYGTRVKQVSVPSVTYVVGYEGFPPKPVLRMEVTYKVVREYWLVEKCDPGGSGCTVGTQRETYQGTAS